MTVRNKHDVFPIIAPIQYRIKSKNIYNIDYEKCFRGGAFDSI